MLADADEARLRLARMFLRARQPLGAAVLFTELARDGSRDPEVWCGLGAALMGSRGTLVRKPFEDWAAYVFRQAEPLVKGTPFAEITAQWRSELPPPTSDDTLGAAELDALQEFLLISEDVLPQAVDGLPRDDHMIAVMILGDHSRHAASVVRAAIGGRWGAAAARAALKRAGRFLDRVDVRAAITGAARAPNRDELEPYLGWALDQIGR